MKAPDKRKKIAAGITAQRLKQIPQRFHKCVIDINTTPEMDINCKNWTNISNCPEALKALKSQSIEYNHTGASLISPTNYSRAAIREREAAAKRKREMEASQASPDLDLELLLSLESEQGGEAQRLGSAQRRPIDTTAWPLG